MSSQALVMIVIAALATGTVAGGGTILTDMAEFEIDIKVVDALTGKPVVGALVEIRDGNGTLIASGLTDKDGEFELDIDDSRVHDDDSDYTNDDCNETDHSDDLSVVSDESDCDDDADDCDGICKNNAQVKASDDDDCDDCSDDCADDHTNASYVQNVLKTIVGPLNIIVSNDGYVTQTVSIELNTMDDCDIKVKLEKVV
jgi:hypothetical protein